MAENRAEIIAGFGVVALAIGFMAYAGFGPLGGGDGRYPLMASFRAADGISVGTDVRLAGVKVGTVSSMALNPQTYFADVEFMIDRKLQLSSDSAALVSSEGLLGGNFIELIPGGMDDILPAGGQIEDTQGSVSLITLLLRFVTGGEDK